MEDGSLFQRMKHLLRTDDEVDESAQKEAAGLIHNIIRYLDKDAMDIMTHRKNIITIDAQELLEDALRFMLDESFSRFPVCEGEIDSVIGIMHLREAMACYLDEKLRKVPLKELKGYIRPAAFIPETKSIDTLFKEMQADKNHIRIVLDEYGQTSGLVTMEDILEEIVGNILDEHDEEEERIRKVQNGNYLVNGMIDLEDLEDVLPIVFEKEEFETLNGFLIHQLDRIPGEDEQCVVDYEGYRFTVLLVDNNTIQRVKIEKRWKE